MFYWIEKFQELFEQGGLVLFSIFIASILLWFLIFERYWFLSHGYKEKLIAVAEQWQMRNDKTSWYAKKLRDGLLAEIQIASRVNLLPIQSLVAVLPLLGLLGTVTGMITIFEVVNVFGTGNARGMAEGISRALLPTTAGLVTSLSGLYFSTDLNRRADRQSELARDLLTQ